jgi:probable F420-dependent oxidoreductase
LSVRFWNAVAFLDTDQLVPIARAAEEAGFYGIAIPDHIFYPKDLQSPYLYSSDGSPPYSPDTPWPDPWVAIAAMAAATERIRFTTNIYIAPARDVFTVAKLTSTASVLSGGRVSLGVGPGWCREEFDQTGQDFATRGKRLDEMIEVLRTLWAGGFVEHHGTHFDFDPLRINPVPSEPIPIYIGGHSKVALRRTARLGDGWIGVAYTPDEAEAKLSEVHAALRDAGRDPDGFPTFMGLWAAQEHDLFRRFDGLGLTDALTAPWMLAPEPTLEARLQAIRDFADVIAAG